MAEARVLTHQLTQIPDSPKIEDVELALSNTLLGPLSDHLGKMRKQVLNRRQRR